MSVAQGFFTMGPASGQEPRCARLLKRCYVPRRHSPKNESLRHQATNWGLEHGWQPPEPWGESAVRRECLPSPAPMSGNLDRVHCRLSKITLLTIVSNVFMRNGTYPLIRSLLRIKAPLKLLLIWYGLIEFSLCSSHHLIIRWIWNLESGNKLKSTFFLKQEGRTFSPKLNVWYFGIIVWNWNKMLMCA